MVCVCSNQNNPWHRGLQRMSILSNSIILLSGLGVHQTQQYQGLVISQLRIQDYWVWWLWQNFWETRIRKIMQCFHSHEMSFFLNKCSLYCCKTLVVIKYLHRNTCLKPNFHFSLNLIFSALKQHKSSVKKTFSFQQKQQTQICLINAWSDNIQETGSPHLL